MQILWLMMLFAVYVLTGCSGSYEYVPPPPGFNKDDLVGKWQATYGITHIDTITLRPDGTYQQIFEAPEVDYHYESPWNEWYIERSPGGQLKLHLEGMRYYTYGVELGEAGGRNPDGAPAFFYDIAEDASIEMVDKVVLRIKGSSRYPRGIILSHMQTDPDVGPEYFVFVDETAQPD